MKDKMEQLRIETQKVLGDMEAEIVKCGSDSCRYQYLVGKASAFEIVLERIKEIQQEE